MEGFANNLIEPIISPDNGSGIYSKNCTNTNNPFSANLLKSIEIPLPCSIQDKNLRIADDRVVLKYHKIIMKLSITFDIPPRSEHTQSLATYCAGKATRRSHRRIRTYANHCGTEFWLWVAPEIAETGAEAAEITMTHNASGPDT